MRQGLAALLLGAAAVLGAAFLEAGIALVLLIQGVTR